MLNTEEPKSYIYSPPEEPERSMRPIRYISGYDRERPVRPRRYTRPERIVRGGMRDMRSSRGSRNLRDNSWREYGMRGRSLRDEVGLRGGRGSMRGDWGIRGREVREWRRDSYDDFDWRRRDDVGFRGRGMTYVRGLRNERIRGGRGLGTRGIPRGPRGYSPRDGRDGRR